MKTLEKLLNGPFCQLIARSSSPQTCLIHEFAELSSYLLAYIHNRPVISEPLIGHFLNVQSYSPSAWETLPIGGDRPSAPTSSCPHCSRIGWPPNDPCLLVVAM